MRTHLTHAEADADCTETPLGCGTLALYSKKAFDQATDNEDSAGWWQPAESTLVLAVADGLGGCPAGAEASFLALESLGEALTGLTDSRLLRSTILDGFELANKRLLDTGVGSATTLVVVSIIDQVARSFHAGDSGALVIGQRGRLKAKTIPHSPVGYGVASGEISALDAHHHEDRHILENCVGSREMRVEIGAPIALAARDTVLLASDGVLDNIPEDDLIELMRCGPLGASLTKVRARVDETMHGRNPALPAHPDDATVIVYRRRTRR